LNLYAEILVGLSQILWPISVVAVAVLAFRIAQKFVPAKNDITLKKIAALENMILDQQTEISKLNVLFGIGQTQKNRENLVRGLTADLGSR
jgi:hypothetical protein